MFDLRRQFERLRAGTGHHPSPEAHTARQRQATLLGVLVATALAGSGALGAAGYFSDRIERERQGLALASFLELERERMMVRLRTAPSLAGRVEYRVDIDGRILGANGAPAASAGSGLAEFVSGQVPGVRGPALLTRERRAEPPRADYVSTVAGPVLAGISAFDPDQRKALVVSRPLDASFLRPFAEREAVTALRIVSSLPPRRSGSSVSRRWIRDRAGHRIAAVEWQRPPGTTMLGYWPALVAVIALTLIFTTLFSDRVGQAVSRIGAGRRQFRDSAGEDPLTGLPNRSFLEEKLAALLPAMDGTGTGAAIVRLDIDDFREINETLGHDGGDAVIREIGSRLTETCRDGDLIVRSGGNEFAMLLSRPGSSTGPFRPAKELLAAVERPLCIGDAPPVHATASIGVVRIDAGDHSPRELLRRAGIALAGAKNNRNASASVFAPAMDAALRRRKSIEADLREALRNDRLDLVYQPQISADGSTLRGVEALLRWKHPTRGDIEPAEFIAIAERSGLISCVGDYVTERGFSDARNWCGVCLSVNVGAAELLRGDYAQKLTERAARLGIEPDRVALEITETRKLENSDVVSGIIRCLREHGFRIVLDDFGTEYCSLSYLRHHPVDGLKIDRGFVAAIGVRRDADIIVAAIIRIAESLGLSVTAEGIETERQRQALREAGCDNLQGYLLSRPVPAEGIDLMLASGRNRSYPGRPGLYRTPDRGKHG